MILKKRQFCCYRAYEPRKYPAVVDWNYHLHLSVATKKKGEELSFQRRVQIRQWDMKIVKVDNFSLPKYFMPGCYDVMFAKHVSLNESDPSL